MNVLVINQFFWPDSAATSQLLADVLRGVDTEVNRVTAVCGTGEYSRPDGSPAPSVEILRVGTSKFSRGKFGRILFYLSFFVQAAFRGLRAPQTDLVVTLTTPPLISLIGTMMQVLRGSKHFVWEMDVYPDIAVDLEIIKQHSLIAKMVGLLADWARGRADGVIVLGEEMKARLVEHGISASKIWIAENWADGAEIYPNPFTEAGPLTVHYSGNFGMAHEEQTITDVIRTLKSDTRFRFVFAGGGVRKERLQRICQHEAIENVEFQPYSSRESLGKSLAGGHLGLVTQLPTTKGSVVPSKTYGIMAAGRPILYVGPAGTTPAGIVERHQCGWRIEPGDCDGMIELLESLHRDRRILEQRGERARRAFDAHYDKRYGIARILGILGLEAAAATVEPSEILINS